jgi:hypothetical protein
MTPTFISHCISVYSALEERAIIKRLPDNSEALVFQGAISPVYQSLGISQTYYGPIFQTLEDVGSILKLQRGGRGQDTVITLRGLPTDWPEDLGWKGGSLTHAKPLTEDSRYGKILQEVQEIAEGTIGGINVPLALMELEGRVVALESKVQRQEDKKGAK